MLKFLLLEDSGCKKELESFLRKHQGAVKMLSEPQDLFSKTDALSQYTQACSAHPKKIVINTTESITMLNVNDIVRCESNRNYTYICMADKKKIIVSKTLMEFEEMLHQYRFLRIHKSHLVNINYIEKYIKSEGGYIMLTDASKLPVSVRKKEFLFNELEKL